MRRSFRVRVACRTSGTRSRNAAAEVVAFHQRRPVLKAGRSSRADRCTNTAPARSTSLRHGMRSWRYRVIPLLAKDGMSFEVIIASDNEANARRQVQSQFLSERYQIAFLGEAR
jgi:hypothetical protein